MDKMVKLHNLTRDKLLKKVKWYEKKYGPYIEKKGVHNWKNLFRKPTLNESVIFVLLSFGIFLGWAYMHDIKEFQKVVNECNAFLAIEVSPHNNSFKENNNSSIIMKEENSIGKGG